jgi:hypothetical protein
LAQRVLVQLGADFGTLGSRAQIDVAKSTFPIPRLAVRLYWMAVMSMTWPAPLNAAVEHDRRWIRRPLGHVSLPIDPFFALRANHCALPHHIRT